MNDCVKNTSSFVFSKIIQKIFLALAGGQPIVTALHVYFSTHLIKKIKHKKSSSELH